MLSGGKGNGAGTCGKVDPGMNKQQIQGLEKISMLWQATDLLNIKYQGSRDQWQHPHYGFSQFESLLNDHSVWLDCYFRSVISSSSFSSLKPFGNEELWKILEETGITALHTNPIRTSGGVRICDSQPGWEYTPSTDGGYDRISYDIANDFGSKLEYQDMVSKASEHNIAIAGDIVPGHTGTGPDFLLGLVMYGQYPSLFHMVSIPEEDWNILPFSEGGPRNPEKFTNLSAAEVDALAARGHIVGRLDACIFYTKGVKETNWSCTGPIACVDGKTRRWVYLHLFKQGQPTLNWLDPMFNAQRLLTGDIIFSRSELGAKILRLDANMLLGVERGKGPRDLGFAAGHPLTKTCTEMLSMMMHKMGGWTYQENSLVLEKLKDFQESGSDMSYDFITRSGLVHAAVSGDATLLNFQLVDLFNSPDVEARRLMHSLQNHDELYASYQAFNENPKKTFNYGGELLSGQDISNRLIHSCYEFSRKYDLPYNEKYGGFMTTFTTIVLGRLGISRKQRDFDSFTVNEKGRVIDALMPLIVFSAIQPGIFQISAWDLLGSIQLEVEEVQEFTADGDFRWCNRPAYDLLGARGAINDAAASNVIKGRPNIPKGRSVFGPLREQLGTRISTDDVVADHPCSDSAAKSMSAGDVSLVQKLQHVLACRKRLNIAACPNQIPLRLSSRGAVGMMHVLQNNSHDSQISPAQATSYIIEITIVNFSNESCTELVSLASYSSNIQEAVHAGASISAASNNIDADAGTRPQQCIVDRRRSHDDIGMSRRSSLDVANLIADASKACNESFCTFDDVLERGGDILSFNMAPFGCIVVCLPTTARCPWAY
eukprot:Nk52_evm6s2524 gene=Nk52_evmTU6s2524